MIEQAKIVYCLTAVCGYALVEKVKITSVVATAAEILGYTMAGDYRGIAAKRRAETRLLSRAAGLDRYAASLEPAEDEKLPF